MRSGRSAKPLFLLSLATVVLWRAGCASVPDEVKEPEALPPARLVTNEELSRRLNQLLPADAFPGEFVLQHRVQIRWRSPQGDGEESFDAAFQKQNDTLLLVGLGPMHRIGFELRLEGGVVQFVNHTGREMPFRPEDILADVQRVYYPWLQPTTSCFDCQRSGDRLGFQIQERIGASLLEERVFRVPEHPEIGSVTIEYSGEPFFEEIPTRIHIRNEWFGYDLLIENLRSDRIEPRGAPSNELR